MTIFCFSSLPSPPLLFHPFHTPAHPKSPLSFCNTMDTSQDKKFQVKRDGFSLVARAHELPKCCVPAAHTNLFSLVMWENVWSRCPVPLTPALLRTLLSNTDHTLKGLISEVNTSFRARASEDQWSVWKLRCLQYHAYSELIQEKESE